MNVTHTYVLLELSAASYEEIKAKLLAACYEHAVNSAGELDMHGLAVVKSAQPAAPVAPHCATCQCNKFPPTPPASGNPNSRSWHGNDAPQLAPK